MSEGERSVSNDSPAQPLSDAALDTAEGGGVHNLTLKHGRPREGANGVYIQEIPSGAQIHPDGVIVTGPELK